jgi:type VI secretion system protein ImpE
MSSIVQERLSAGELEQAIELLNAEVRQNPLDINRRASLAELLCIAGQLERADTLLDAIDMLDPSAALGVALFRQLLRAELARQQFYAEGRLPEFVAKPEGSVELELRAAVSLQRGAEEEAASLLSIAESLRPASAGMSDGTVFADFRDLDDVSAGHFEILTSTGKYYWIPVSRVGIVEFRSPRCRRDLLWRPAFMSVIDGPDGEVFFPTIYGCFAAELPARHRLGHATDYTGTAGGAVLGVGLRSFLVGAESRTILELGKIEFSRS